MAIIKDMKKGDTEPYLRVQLNNIYADPIRSEPAVLTGATVKFIMKHRISGTVKVDATLAGSELVDLSTGEVQYEWESADTDTPGEYVCEFEVTKANSNVKTWWDMRTAQEIQDAVDPQPLIIRIVEDFG